MPTVLEMAEMHLINVAKEVQILEQKKAEIDSEVNRLKSFIDEAAVVVEGAKSEAQAALDSPTTATSSSTNPFQGVTN